MILRILLIISSFALYSIACIVTSQCYS